MYTFKKEGKLKREIGEQQPSRKNRLHSMIIAYVRRLSIRTTDLTTGMKLYDLSPKCVTQLYKSTSETAIHIRTRHTPCFVELESLTIG